MFINCRIYNGAESIVGRIGTQIQTEAESLIRGLRLRERFKSPEERTRFILDEPRHIGQDIGTINLNNNNNHGHQNKEIDSANEQSEDDIPKHDVPYHNNEMMPSNERTYDTSPRNEELQPDETKNDQIFEEE